MISGRKLKTKFLSPYKIIKVKPNDIYDVQRVSTGDGRMSVTCIQCLKSWILFSLVI